MFRFRGSWSSGSSYLYVGFDLRVLLVKIFRVFVSVFGFWQWLTLFVCLFQSIAETSWIAVAQRTQDFLEQHGGGGVHVGNSAVRVVVVMIADCSSWPSTCPQMALVDHDSERWCAQLWRLSSWLLCLGRCLCAHCMSPLYFLDAVLSFAIFMCVE